MPDTCLVHNLDTLIWQERKMTYIIIGDLYHVFFNALPSDNFHWRLAVALVSIFDWLFLIILAELFVDITLE